MKTVITVALLLFGTIALPSLSAAAPTLMPPTTENVSAGLVTLVLQSSESGTGYFTLLSGSGIACGTGTQVKAGQNSAGSLVRYRGSLSLSANSPRRYTVRNLPQSTAYTVCFTADSPSDQNLQEMPSSSNFGTSAAISLTDKEWNTVGSAGFSSGQATGISMIFASDGTPYIAYSDGGNGGKVTVMKFSSGIWSVVGSAGFSPNPSQATSLAFAPDGTLYLAYQYLNPSNITITTLMEFRGSSWVLLGTKGGNNSSQAFAPNGDLFIVISDLTSGGRATVINFSTGFVGNAGFSTGVASATSISIASDGTPCVAYQDSGNLNRITAKRFLGTTWNPNSEGTYSSSVGTAGFTKMALSPDNTAYVAFQGVSGRATVARWSGGAPSLTTFGTVSTGTVTDVTLAIAPDGFPVVAFQDVNTGGKATAMKFYNGTGWVALGSAGFSSGSATPVTLAFAPDGRPYAAFGDGATGKATVMRLDVGNTTTTISADKVIASTGETVTFTAAISKTTATGTVSFKDGATVLGTAQLSNGVATYSTTNLSVGFHTITAVYAGDSNFIGSTSAAQQVEIRPVGFVVVSAIASPVSGYATNAASLTISGTASSADGDPVLLVEVSADGSATWQAAAGTTSWSRTFSFPLEGNFTIRSRATTATGIVETPADGISVSIDRTAPTGTIVSAVQSGLDSLTVTLNSTANTPGMGCYGVYPNACGYQEITLSYDRVTWTPWQQVMTTRQYSIAMVGRQTTVYANLRDSAGNLSAQLSAPVIIGGVCGSAHTSNFVAIPTTGLCALGTPSAVIGAGPWSWFCSDPYGGATASCSAKQAGGVVFRSSDAGLTWTEGKSGSGFNSAADALLVSPTYASDRTLFLGADGIYKSVDSGDNWKKVLTSYMVKAFAASPEYATDRTIFAGAYLSGILKSSDGGDTWIVSNVGLTPTMVFSLAISPGFSSDHTIFAGIYGAGVYKSIDRGATWSASNSGISTSSALSLAISPAFVADQTLFAAVTDGIYGSGGPYYNVYKSTDGGLTWNQSDSGISGAIIELGISPGYASDRTIFAVTSSGVYKSTDGGSLWTQVNTATSGNSLALSPAYTADQTLFAGVYGVNVFKSGTGGNSWSSSVSDFAVSNHLASLAVSPSFASDRSVFALTYLIGPNLSIAPSNLSFGAVKSGSTSQTKQITIRNDNLYGDAALIVNDMNLSAPNGSEFRIAPGTCGSLKPTLPIGGQCDIDVSFMPSSTGSKSATLQISSNAAMPMQSEIALTGNGISVSSMITTPASGYITNGTNVTVAGTATSVGGDSVALVEVSVDGGATWQPTTGTASWSRSFLFPLEGVFAIKSRATTNAGVVEAPAVGITVTIDRTAPTGNIMSAVLNDSNSVTLALNTRANTPGWGCLDYLPIVCGYQDITLSYDGSTWTPWVQALATQQYSITMIGQQATVYAKLRDSAGNISLVLSAPVKFPGVCGADNGNILAASAPLALCDKGTPSGVSGAGHPWSWTCQGDVGTVPAVCSASIKSFTLSVGIKDGAGKGDIQADLASDDVPPISVFCPSISCTAHFDFGRTVQITATPDSISTFTAWEGVCSTNPCDIVMSADTTVTAAFTRDASYKNNKSGTLDNSLDALLLSVNPGDEIRILATELTINSLVLNKALALTGGWKAGHEEPAAEPTVLSGAITVQDSEIQLENLTLKGILEIESGALRVHGVTVRQ